MTNKKPGVMMTWLPLIFVTALNGSVAMAEGQGQMPQPQVQQAALPAAGVGHDFSSMLADLAKRFPAYSTARILVVDTTGEKMLLLEQGRVAGEWVISTAAKGVGSQKGSDQTPLGVHRIAQKIGAGAAFGAIFKSRQDTGRVATILTRPDQDSAEDAVTSRVMWLDGLEPGVNKGGNVDSHERFIYIHGTDEEGKLGHPASHGCIRMRNKDVIDLFDKVDENTLVVITRQG